MTPKRIDFSPKRPIHIFNSLLGQQLLDVPTLFTSALANMDS